MLRKSVLAALYVDVDVTVEMNIFFYLTTSDSIPTNILIHLNGNQDKALSSLKSQDKYSTWT